MPCKYVVLAWLVCACTMYAIKEMISLVIVLQVQLYFNLTSVKRAGYDLQIII